MTLITVLFWIHTIIAVIVILWSFAAFVFGDNDDDDLEMWMTGIKLGAVWEIIVYVLFKERLSELREGRERKAENKLKYPNDPWMW